MKPSSEDPNITLIRQYRDTGNKRILNDLVIRNQALVVSIARKHFGSEFDDLFQAGCIGLIRAVERFDLGRGTRFSTYAVFWIRFEMSRLMPESYSGKINNYREFYRIKGVMKGKYSEPDDIKKYTGCSEKNAEVYSVAIQYPVRIDATISRDLPHLIHLDHLPSDDISPEEKLSDRQDKILDKKTLASLLRTLSPKEQSIIRARFYRENTETLESISKKFNITRERVRQIQEKALTKLRRAAKQQKLRAA